MNGKFATIAFGFCGWIVMLAASTGPGHAADVIATFKPTAVGSKVTVDHGVWDRLLRSYVVVGNDGVNRVAYGKFKAADHGTLKTYVAGLQKIDPSTLDSPEQFAFWTNLYNARTIDIVLDKYPVKSIKNINLGGGLKTLVTGGPWQAKVVRVSGIEMTLDDIENSVLRPKFKDPRVHYAVNCASIGCPNLATQAYTGAKLDGMLADAAVAFINSPRGFLVEGDQITASSIYDWFRADFGGTDAAVFMHARKYANPTVAAKLERIGKIGTHTYDWTLADAK
jgi:Protein of unknown function, DUF547